MLDFIEDAINNYACFEHYRACDECPIQDLECDRCGTALRGELEKLIYNGLKLENLKVLVRDVLDTCYRLKHDCSACPYNRQVKNGFLMCYQILLIRDEVEK